MCVELKKYFLGVTKVTPGPLLQTKVKLMEHGSHFENCGTKTQMYTKFRDHGS